MAGETPESPRLGESAAQKVLRFVWTYGPPLILLPLVILILRRETLSVGILDAAFWAVVLVVAMCRGVESFRYGGRTAEGQPGTAADFRLYALKLSIGALIAWVVAHLYGYCLLREQGEPWTP